MTKILETTSSKNGDLHSTKAFHDNAVSIIQAELQWTSTTTYAHSICQ